MYTIIKKFDSLFFISYNIWNLYNGLKQPHNVVKHTISIQKPMKPVGNGMNG